MHSVSDLDLRTEASPVETVKSPANGIPNLEDCNDKHSIGAVKTAPKDPEQPLQSPTHSRKRDSAEPGEQPELKRAKKSPASPTNGNVESSEKDPSEYPDSADTITKETWQGFCEIQSEPAFFSAILQDMGVRNIKVEEVVSMHPEYLKDFPIPRSSYGLILLYQYRDHGSSDQPKEASSHVWFANQLPAQNSCATLAMINILMNNGDVEIGEHLQQFKEFTKDFSPYQRGEAFASFDFVKRIHNSFAKKMDILEADKHLSHKAKKSQRLSNDKKSRRRSTDSAATDNSANGHEDNAHHFIAFIPIGNEIWMLDGLNAQPINVGTFDAKQGADWVSVAVDSTAAITAGGGDDYTAFTIGPSKLPSLRKQACLAINHVKLTELRLDEISPDWKSFIVDEQFSPRPHMLGIEDQLSVHPTPDTLAATIAGEETRDLLERRARVLKDLEHLATSIVSEMQTEADDAQKAAQGRFDHGPVIKLWAEMLAANGYLEQNLERHIEGKSGNKKGKK